MRKWIVLMLLCVFIGASCFAGEAGTTEKGLSLDDYHDQLSIIHNDAHCTDEEKLQRITSLYLEIKRDQTRNYDKKDFDFQVFYDATSENYAHLSYMQEKIEYEKMHYKREGVNIVSDDLTLNFSEIDIHGDTADISVYAVYEYIDAWFPNLNQASGVQYDFSFCKVDNVWLMTDILTDSSFDEAYRDVGLSPEVYTIQQDEMSEKAVNNIVVGGENSSERLADHEHVLLSTNYLALHGHMRLTIISIF